MHLFLRVLCGMHTMGILAALPLGACGVADDEAVSAAVQPSASTDDTSRPARTAPIPECEAGGMLGGEIFGSIEATIDWRDGKFDCEGMQRPAGAGARLRFAGNADENRPLTFIIALPDLARGEPARETPATVTLIEENSGRFYSNGNVASCWSDVHRHELLGDSRYTLDGIVYCVAALAEINGGGSVSFSELRFSGQVDWAYE